MLGSSAVELAPSVWRFGLASADEDYRKEVRDSCLAQGAVRLANGTEYLVESL
jgi:hypothetical protein